MADRMRVSSLIGVPRGRDTFQIVSLEYTCSSGMPPACNRSMSAERVAVLFHRHPPEGEGEPVGPPCRSLSCRQDGYHRMPGVSWPLPDQNDGVREGVVVSRARRDEKISRGLLTQSLHRFFTKLFYKRVDTRARARDSRSVTFGPRAR